METSWLREILSATGGDVLYNFLFKPAVSGAAKGAEQVVEMRHDYKADEAERARPVEAAVGTTIMDSYAELSRMLLEEFPASKFHPADRQRMYAAYLFRKAFFDSYEALALEKKPEPVETKKERDTEVPLPKNISVDFYRELLAEQKKRRTADDRKATKEAKKRPYYGKRIAELVENKDFLKDRLKPILKKWNDNYTADIVAFEQALMAVSEDPERGLIDAAKKAAKDLDKQVEKWEENFKEMKSSKIAMIAWGIIALAFIVSFIMIYNLS